jgi:deazaflavin-dependent oxidoreductase (nitroreductase family)
MRIPRQVASFNRRFLNPLTLRLAGRGSMADLEHVGRTSGRTYHTPLMAFRDGDTLTIALTYGPDVQWLKNVTAAGGCRMRLGGQRLVLGTPRRLEPVDGLGRTPNPQRLLLGRVIGCRDFIELPILTSSPQS